MRKKSFRKHLRKLTTDQERQEAKAERARQTARKQQLIADYVAIRKKAKKVGSTENLINTISEGKLLSLRAAIGTLHQVLHLLACITCWQSVPSICCSVLHQQTLTKESRRYESVMSENGLVSVVQLHANKKPSQEQALQQNPYAQHVVYLVDSLLTCNHPICFPYIKCV